MLMNKNMTRLLFCCQNTDDAETLIDLLIQEHAWLTQRNKNYIVFNSINIEHKNILVKYAQVSYICSVSEAWIILMSPFSSVKLFSNAHVSFFMFHSFQIPCSNIF